MWIQIDTNLYARLSTEPAQAVDVVSLQGEIDMLTDITETLQTQLDLLTTLTQAQTEPEILAALEERTQGVFDQHLARESELNEKVILLDSIYGNTV